MTDEDISLSEKRVYGETDGATTAFVAAEIGLVRVSISDDIVGEFTLDRRGKTEEVASDTGRLAIATPNDVLVADEGEFHETGFGPATAIGYRDDLVAAGGGRVARFDDSWTTLSKLDDVRAVGGSMVAAESGIHRLDGGHVGLDDACDVATVGTPLAATGSGLYYLANGWMRALDGPFQAVSSDGDTTHAASEKTLYSRSVENDWQPAQLPTDGRIVDIDHGAGVYAVTEGGSILANVGDGWRHRSIGVTGVTGLAVL